MTTLEIIVAHYKEPWETGRMFFDLMEHQRGVNREDYRLTVVQDGADGRLDWDEIRKNYSYPIRVVEVPHGGISRARNAGIDNADAEWIMFCDFDDTFTSIYSLRTIMELLKTERANDFDFLHTPFVSEYMTKDGLGMTENVKETVWTHGKVFRLSFLRGHKLRFNEDLWFSEDSCFLSIMHGEIDPERKARIKPPTYPLYAWIFNPDSVTSRKENAPKFAGQLLKRHAAVMAHLKKIGDEESYGGMAVRAMWDMYYETGLHDVPVETLRQIGAFYRKHKADIAKVEPEHARKVGECSTKEHAGECNKHGWPKTSFEDWLGMIDTNFSGQGVET